MSVIIANRTFAAKINDNPAIASALLDAGAEAAGKDTKGMRAYDYAQKNPKLKGTGILRRLGE